MGQSTYAIMFGVLEKDMPEGTDLFGEDGDSGLVGQWRAACADKIRAYDQRCPREGWGDPDGEDVYVPKSPYEGLDMLGFYVAAGASGKAGVPTLDGFDLSRVKATYRDAYRAARRRWRRFARWAAAHGMRFPEARPYLTRTEVA